VLSRADGLAAGTEQLTEPHVAVREVGELGEEALGHAVGVIELAGVNQIDGGVGQPVQALGLVVNRRPPGGARWANGERRPLLCGRGGGGGLVCGQAALLVLLAAAAGTGGRLMPAVDETTLPRSLVERFEPGRVDGGALASLLRVLQPISTRPWLWASAS
jgi:hypothetical protein